MSLRLAVYAMLAVTLLTAPVARGLDFMLNDSQITSIRANCVDVQSTLTRIFSNDVLARVHLGGEYDTISSKYMAPMNSRIALNKLDGVALAKTTLDFNTKLDEFRNLYQQYKETMAHATSMKCKDQPVEFYDTIITARTRRALVHDCVATLNTLAKQYQTQVDDLKQKALAMNKSRNQ